MARQNILQNVTNFRAATQTENKGARPLNLQAISESSEVCAEEEIYGHRRSEVAPEDMHLLYKIQMEDLGTPMMQLRYQQAVLNDLYLREKNYLANRNYLRHQTQINAEERQALVDYVIKIHYKLGFSTETLFMCVNLIDRFLSKKFVNISKVKLFGVASLYICAKYEEVVSPPIESYIGSLLLENIKEADILGAERCILKVLDFDLMYVQPIAFLRYITKCNRYETSSRVLAKYLMEICLLHEEFIGVKGSLIATAAFSLSLKILQKKSPLLKYFVRAKSEDVENLEQLMLFVIINRDVSPYLSKKYTHKSVLDVSTFLLKYIEKYKLDKVDKEKERKI